VHPLLTTHRRVAAIALALLIAASGSAPARADVVHLKGGRQLVGRVVEDGDPVKIEVSGGMLSLPRWRVDRVERAELPEATYARDRAALVDGDVDGALALATTARDLQRSADEGVLLELAARWDPKSPSVAERLWNWRVMDRRIEADEQLSAKLLTAFGQGARLHRSTHWRIAHNVDEETARACAGMLEATWRSYHRFIVRLGLRPRPIERRLEALLFADHADWVKSTGLPEESLTGLNGLFVGQTGRILLFDAGNAPTAESAAAQVGENVVAIATRQGQLDAKEVEIADARAQLDAWRPALSDQTAIAEKQSQLEQLETIVAQVEDERRELRVAAQQLERYRTRLNSWWNTESVASALHEACHQISFHIGVSRDDHPLWLNEGLATLFESSTASAIVPESVNRARLRDLRRAWSNGVGGDLRSLIADREFAKSDGTAAAYAETWALTHFLVVRHREAFARFLRTAPRGDAPHAPYWQAAFRAAFGDDLAAIQKQWRRYVRDL